MLKYIVKRILLMIPVMLCVLFIAFGLSAITKGDPVDQIVGLDAPEEVRQAKREELGLDDPFPVRFVRYVKNIVLHGDMGNSYATKQPVAAEVLSKFPNTLRLTLLSVLVALLIAIPLGVISAVKQYSVIDNASMVFALFGVSIPQFWFALMTILIFAVKLKWLPSTTINNGAAGWVLPIAMIGFANVGNLARVTRSSMLEVIRQDYIRTARAKGQRESVVIVKHGLRNAVIPIIANVGNTIGVSLGGAVIAESIFSVDGVGLYMLNAINARNWPSVQGGLVILALSFSIVMLIMDILYTFADPRLKDEFENKNKLNANRRAAKRAMKEGGAV